MIVGTPSVEQRFFGTFNLDESSIRLLSEILHYDIKYGDLAAKHLSPQFNPAKVDEVRRELLGITQQMVAKFDKAREDWRSNS